MDCARRARLTPEKYHYNHVPVSGRVEEIYMIDGRCHSCNPGAVVSMVTPFSKNRRVITVIDTDVPGDTGIGLVAMIEIVAMMIGQIVQCYSESCYSDPKPITAAKVLSSVFVPLSVTVRVPEPENPIEPLLVRLSAPLPDAVMVALSVPAVKRRSQLWAPPV